jgi:nucleoside-diphosphate-sugar epimerase
MHPGRPMNVFVAGATGALGIPTVQALLAAGHRVRGTARGEEKAARLRALGAEAVTVDLYDGRALAETVAGSEAVLHLATKIPPPSRPWLLSRRFQLENDRLRSEASALLVNAALAAQARVYVQESITFVYADAGEKWIDEDTTLQPTPLLLSALDAERETQRFTESGGRGISLRFAGFYGPNARSTHESVRLARYRLFPTFGTGENFFSSIHVDDAAAAAVAALDAPAGTYNIGDDQPVRFREYTEALAHAFGFGRSVRLPAAVARLALGPLAEVVLRSHRVSNRRFKEATAWAPRHASVREGWRAIAAAMRAG